jgi:hypothetical protein
VLCHFFPPNQPSNEYEGGCGPVFTPPTKPRTGNHGAAGGFDHGDHGAATVGGLGDPTGGWWLQPRRSGLVWHAAAAGGLGDLTSSGRLRPRWPRRGDGRVSCGGSGQPRRSGWRRVASTMVATVSTTAARHQCLPARI